MGNIIGEGFDPKIKSQVERRQQVFGAIDKTNYQRYLNGRNPWIKLTSSVNIDAERIGLLGNIATSPGNELAKNNVLFSGTSIGNNIRKGFSETYSVGGLSQGYRPMPGIVSLESKNRNRGSVRETNIQIRAYNTEQFNIIDVLYLRVGFTVLAEWGHSIYVDNEGVVKDMISSDTLSSKFLDGGFSTQKDCMKAIIDKKKDLDGNYDATYGKVANFSWSFEQDGTYTINLVILSLGDVIESLKINTISIGDGETPPTAEQQKETEEDIEEADTEEEIIEFSKNKDVIARLFFDARNLLNKGTATGQISLASDTDVKALGFESNADIVKFIEVTRINESRYYVRLGGFLYYLLNERLFYNKDVPVVDIDFDEETNLIFTTPYVLSSDPRVCIVQADIKMTGKDALIFPDLPKKFKQEIAGIIVGKLMNVYFNMTYILKAMDEIKDEDGKVSLYDLLNKLCQGINSSLGNVNKLSVTIDEENNNRVYFVDETSLPKRDEIIKALNPGASTDLTRFEVYGYKPNQSSFVNSLSIKTEITNELATMITIGAQAGGSAVGEDATAFSNWNKGLTDRVFKVKQIEKTQEEIDNSKDDAEKKIKEVNKKNDATIKEYSNFIIKMEELNFDDSINTFPTTLTNFLEVLQSQESIATQTSSPTIGFIPFNLSLSMVGLSGMKIFNKFSINNTFLPSNYDNTLEFLLKGITQKVDNISWSTDIEALCIPKSISSGANPSLQYTAPPLTTTETGGTYTTTGSGPQATTAEQKVAASVLVGISAGKCGVKVEITSIPGIDKPEDPLRKTAIQKAFNATFINGQYIKGMCGRYTYNHAYNYIQALTGKPLSNGARIPANGNANQFTYWANLVKLGYTQHVAGKNIPKATLKTLLEGSIEFNLGDVVVYWANTGGGVTQTYGHTQMYVGSSIKLPKNLANNWPLQSQFITDNFTNFSSNFVYNRAQSNCWNLLVFRAPISPAQIVDTSSSRGKYVQIVQELAKILLLNDKFYRENKTALLSDAKGTFRDDTELAIRHLNELLGFSGTNQFWGKKLQPQYQSLSPADKQLFDTEYNKLKDSILKRQTSFDFILPLINDPASVKFLSLNPNF